MDFLENFSKILSDLTGISQTPILLTTYSVIAIIIIDLLEKGITFLNTKLNKNDRNLYFNIKELPFIDVYSNDDLVNKILDFNEDKYKKDLKQFSSKVGSFEDGNASYNVAKRIEKICFN